MRLKVSAYLLVLLLALCGCSAANATNKDAEEKQEYGKNGDAETSGNRIEGINNTESEGIAFEYFYRGFTPLFGDEELDYEKVLGTVVITHEEDWYLFANSLCPAAGFYTTPDFTQKYLVVDASVYGSHPSAIASYDVERVIVSDNEILALADTAVSDSCIYANNSHGIGHLFVNVLVIDRKDVPENIQNVLWLVDKGADNPV